MYVYMLHVETFFWAVFLKRVLEQFFNGGETESEKQQM